MMMVDIEAIVANLGEYLIPHEVEDHIASGADKKCMKTIKKQ